MIKLTRLSGLEFYLDAEKIEYLEATPDTVISLLGGKTVMVKESVEVVVKKVIHYRRRLHAPFPSRGKKKIATAF
ncbi:hypothetical protein AUK22_04250 [bacterium CG2_30_54_10]|nr:MAG: hypothetical protein AUK22_04250 [bacterium CG2_30_54_10]